MYTRNPHRNVSPRDISDWVACVACVDDDCRKLMRQVESGELKPVVKSCTANCNINAKIILNFEFSIENAEIMENCPWKMMILY